MYIVGMKMDPCFDKEGIFRRFLNHLLLILIRSLNYSKIATLDPSFDKDRIFRRKMNLTEASAIIIATLYFRKIWFSETAAIIGNRFDKKFKLFENCNIGSTFW